MDEIIIPITLELSFRMKEQSQIALQPYDGFPVHTPIFGSTGDGSLLGKALKSDKKKAKKTKKRVDSGKTKEEIQTELANLKDYISKHESKMPLADIAEELGVSYHRVYHAKRTMK